MKYSLTDKEKLDLAQKFYVTNLSKIEKLKGITNNHFNKKYFVCNLLQPFNLKKAIEES